MERHTESSASPGPVRTCVGCRGRAAKSELVRVTAVVDATGRTAIVPDLGGAAPGRGAHLHPDPACYELAVRRRAFTRALRLTALSPEGPTSTQVRDRIDQVARHQQDEQDQQHHEQP